MSPTRSLFLNSEDFEKERRHYELLLASRARHPELALTRRPTVEDLLQRAACAKDFMGDEIGADLADLGQFTHLEAEDPIYFDHRVGDGLHYINNNALIFPSGKTQLGDTSEGCILLNIFMVLAEIRKIGLEGGLWNPAYPKDHIAIGDKIYAIGWERVLWNLAYPEDFMAIEDIAHVLCAARQFCEDFDAGNPENIKAAIQDLYDIRCDRLAEIILCSLRAKGVHLP